MKRFIFMSGEFGLTASIAARMGWEFTTKPRRALRESDGFRLEGMSTTFVGGLYYAAYSEVERVESTLNILSDFPCWPDPRNLLKMVDRHVVARECVKHGFHGDDDVSVGCTWSERAVDCDTVLKVGNEHSGEGKFLVRAGEMLPFWDGVATLEPFHTGRSVRVLHLGLEEFVVETVNPDSWVKNSPGGENVLLHIDTFGSSLLSHSRRVRDHFGLDVCGNDYVVQDDGKFHFLETNQFPGLGDEFLRERAEVLLLERLRLVETSASRT